MARMGDQGGEHGNQGARGGQPGDPAGFDDLGAEQERAAFWSPARGWPPDQRGATRFQVNGPRDPGPQPPDADDGELAEPDPRPARARQAYPATGWHRPADGPAWPRDGHTAEVPAPRMPAGRDGRDRYAGAPVYDSFPGPEANGGWRARSPASPAPGPQYGSPYPAQRPAPREAGYGEPAPPQGRQQQPLWLVLLLAGLVAALVTIVVILLAGLVAARDVTGGKAAGAAVAPLAPAVTMARARQVLGTYAAAENTANRTRSLKVLAAIETGSSYLLDAGQYRRLDTTDPGNETYVPLTLASPALYIPMLSRAAYPRWFVARVTYVAAAGQYRGAHSWGYIVFASQGPGRPWKNQLEPYDVPGAAPAPRIALDSRGYATAVSPAARLAARPAALPAATAATLNGAGQAITIPALLADQGDEAFWRRELPAGSSVTDAHGPAAGAVYAIRTADGGALVLFAGSAVLRLAPPPGQTFQIVVPGFYSGSEAIASAALGYAEQFAATDPPRGRGTPSVLADVSGADARI